VNGAIPRQDRGAHTGRGGGKGGGGEGDGWRAAAARAVMMCGSRACRGAPILLVVLAIEEALQVDHLRVKLLRRLTTYQPACARDRLPIMSTSVLAAARSGVIVWLGVGVS
jgi:hypothetical protein